MTQIALLLVDIQNDYFPSFDGSRMPLPDMDAATRNAVSLLQAARQAAVPIFHVQHVMASAEAPFFRPESAGAELHPSVTPGKGETVIQKARPNSFVGTDLQRALQEADVSRLLICGAMSQMCIDATTRAAVDLGYAVTLAEDACAAAAVAFNGQEVPAALTHAAIMAPLAMSYADVRQSNACLSLLGA